MRLQKTTEIYKRMQKTTKDYKKFVKTTEDERLLNTKDFVKLYKK